jgi:Domain of Unknown Function (DUF1080)
VLTRRCFIIGGLAVVGQAQKALLDDGDFSQWQSVGAGLWAAEGGEIVGRFDKNRPGPGYLFTREVFTDFRLTVVFRISSGGKSGIYLREPHRKWSLEGDDRPGCGPDCGYAVALNYQDKDNPTGTILNVQKSKKTVGSEEKWNEMEIVCRGSEIRISISGQVVNKFNQMKIQPGAVGFEIPGAASQDFSVRFRDIKLTTVS